MNQQMYQRHANYKEVLEGVLDKVGKIENLSETQLQALFLKKQEIARLQRETPILFYEPYLSRIKAGHYPQDLFHRNLAKIRLFVGGNRCLGGESEIYDPVKGKYRRIEEIHDRFHVKSYDGEKLVTAIAKEPFRKDVGELYDVKLSNGEKFTCSLSHQLMTSSGEYLSLFDVLFLKGGVLFGSSLGFCPKVHVSGEYRSLKTAEDFENRYFEHSRQYDGQPLVGTNSVPDIFPLQDDVEERTFFLASLRRGDLTDKIGCIRAYQRYFHPSSMDDLQHYEGLYADILSDVSCKLCKLTLDSRKVAVQSNYGSFLPQSKTESVQQDTQICSTKTLRPPITTELVVISIAYNRTDVKWDFEVPELHNYYLGGAIHHNSGKSEAGFIEDVWCALGIHPYIKMPIPNIGWIVSLSFKKQLEVTEPKLKKFLPPNSIKRWDNQSGCIDLVNGSQIWLKSCEQDLTTFGGVSIHWCHCDEEPPGSKGKSIYDELLMRSAEYRGKIWFTLTPVSGMSWTYDELIEKSVYDKDIYYIEVDSRENPFIPLDELEGIAKKLSQDELEMRLKGKYIQFSGLVYKEFQKETHVIPPFEAGIPREWPKFRGLDHGINRDHPTSCIYLAVSPQGDYYIYDEYVQSDKTIRENCENIRIISGADRFAWSCIDPATEARDPQTGKTNRNEYRDCGIPTRAERTDKNAGINFIKQLLLPDPVTKRPRLYIFNTCYNLIREFSRYRWRTRKSSEESRSNEVVKIGDDCLDALRYLLMSKPRFDVYDEIEDKQENEPWY